LLNKLRGTPLVDAEKGLRKNVISKEGVSTLKDILLL
jgi:hypothetical protein